MTFHAQFEEIVTRALAEDIGPGDLTTWLTVPAGKTLSGDFRAHESGIFCGADIARSVFHQLDSEIEFTNSMRDGERISTDDTVMRVNGAASAIMTGERVALNFIQRMSGVATLTAEYVAAVSHTQAKILDTRKTAPGLRMLDKYAVRCGGGHNHRFGLSDGILIKDNHIIAAGGITEAVEAARKGAPHGLKIEVEVDDLSQIEPALSAGADILLLDNMDVMTLGEAVVQISGRVLTEASGGVDLESVRSIAETRVDFISVGRLTHSVRALDIGLDVEF